MPMILKKIYIPEGNAGKIGNFPLPGILPAISRLTNLPEMWSIEVKIDGRLLRAPISKKQFNFLHEGQQCDIVYKTTQNDLCGWIYSISGEKIEYK